MCNTTLIITLWSPPWYNQLCLACHLYFLGFLAWPLLSVTHKHDLPIIWPDLSSWTISCYRLSLFNPYASVTRDDAWPVLLTYCHLTRGASRQDTSVADRPVFTSHFKLATDSKWPSNNHGLFDEK